MEMALKPGMLVQFREAAAVALKDTAARPGFRSIRVFPGHGVDRALFIEEWDSAEDYQAYLDWRAAGNSSTGIRDCAAGKPEIKIWDDQVLAY